MKRTDIDILRAKLTRPSYSRTELCLLLGLLRDAAELVQTLPIAATPCELEVITMLAEDPEPLLEADGRFWPPPGMGNVIDVLCAIVHRVARTWVQRPPEVGH